MSYTIGEIRGAALVAILVDAIERGRTVYILSNWKAWKITPGVAASWAKSGRPIFKASADGTNALMGQGKGYVCIDWSGWRIV